MSANRLEQIQEQLTKNIPTYVFLYGGSSAVRTTLDAITGDAGEVDDDRLPGYYGKDQCNLFVRVRDFEALGDQWVPEHLVLASNPDPAKTQGALSNQTNPLYVFELRGPDTAGGIPPAVATEQLTREWLRQRTLWPDNELDELVNAIDERGQVILAGPPGTGKTWVADHVARYLTQDEPEAPSGSAAEAAAR